MVAKILLSISLVLMGFTLPAAVGDSAQAIYDSAQAVYKITAQKKHASAFFVTPNVLVTNFHVLRSRIEDVGDQLSEIVLIDSTNKPTQIKITKVISASATHDVAFLETEQPVNNYLNFHEPLNLNFNESGEVTSDFYIVGYLGGQEIQRIQNSGPLSIIDGQVIMPYDPDSAPLVSRLKGMSGSPLLDNKGHVVGIFKTGYYNLAVMTTAKFLKIIKEDPTYSCQSLSATKCVEKTQILAYQKLQSGDVYAQYFFGYKYDMIGAQARQYPGGQTQALSYKKQAYNFYRQAAEQGHILSAYNLGKFYLQGFGVVKPDYQKALKWFGPPMYAGYLPAYFIVSEMYGRDLNGIQKNQDKADKLLELVKEKGFRAGNF